MSQKTAKTVEDVLNWIEATPHHYASVCDEPGFFILKGYGDKLRIPYFIQDKTLRLVEPSKDKFDNRMYRATKSGRARLRRAKNSVDPTA